MPKLFQSVRRVSRVFPLVLLALLPLKASEQRSIQTSDLTSWDEFAFRIEDSKTRVGLASVNLSVSELKPVDGELIGEYAIEVPLMSSKNDNGQIVLPLNKSVSELGKTGGVLRGKAISAKNENTINQIVCEVRPLTNKGIRLAITTPDRTLHFESKYTVIEVKEDGS